MSRNQKSNMKKDELAAYDISRPLGVEHDRVKMSYHLARSKDGRGIHRSYHGTAICRSIYFKCDVSVLVLTFCSILNIYSFHLPHTNSFKSSWSLKKWYFSFVQCLHSMEHPSRCACMIYTSTLCGRYHTPPRHGGGAPRGTDQLCLGNV